MKKVTVSHDLVEHNFRSGARWPSCAVTEGLSEKDTLVFARLNERRDIELFFALEGETTDVASFLEAKPCELRVHGKFEP